MIFIIIEHINGEIDNILPKFTISIKEVKEYILNGYIVIGINLQENKVSEIDDSWRG